MKKYLIFVLSMLTSVAIVASSPSRRHKVDYYSKIEPANWWAGMKSPELQLMVYGENVGKCRMITLEDDIKIVRTERTRNPNYLFVYIDVRNVNPGVHTLVLQGSRGVQNIKYEFLPRTDGAAVRRSFGAQDAVYLIMPDRFANGNIDNDSVAGYCQGVLPGNLHKRQGGDIQGIIEHLDYIEDLGMTALWTTPLFDDNDVQYSYHHYATTDIYRVDPRFGSNEDFKRLVDSCHSHNLKYIMDIVPNHINPRYWWADDIPDSAWYHRWPEFTRTNYTLSVQTDPHASEADKKELTQGWFDTNMADLDLTESLLFDYMRQAYIYWIEYTGLDGLRVDTYPYNNLQDVSRLMHAIRNEYPFMNIVGECWVKTVPEMAYYQSGNNNKDGFDSGLPTVIDFMLKDYLEWVFVEDENWNTGLIRFYSHFAQDFAFANPNLIMNMIDNHDMSRYSNAVNGDTELYKMGLALIAVVRGFPQYYYGDEIMIYGKGGTYEDARHRFPGGWADDERSAFDMAQRTEVENEVLDYLRAILQFRKNSKALTEGRMMQFIPRDGIYCFFRYTDTEKVMVVVNNNSEDKHVDLTRFREILPERTVARDIVTGNRTTLMSTCTFKGKYVTILELE